MTLNINQIRKIQKLHQKGFSLRQIAKEAGRDKNTVNKYIRIYGNQQWQPLIYGPEKKYEYGIPIYQPSPTRNEANWPQAPHYYSSNQDPCQPEQQYGKIDVTKIIREMEEKQPDDWLLDHKKWRLKNQEFDNKIHQIKQLIISEDAECSQQKVKEIRQKNRSDDIESRKVQYRNSIEADKKRKEKLQNLEETIINKNQQYQKWKILIPISVGKKMREMQSLRREKEEKTQRDEKRHLENASLQKKPENIETSKETDHSSLGQALIHTGIPIFCKFLNFQFTLDPTIPINSDEYRLQLNKFLQSL